MHFLAKGEGQPFFFQHGLGSNLNQPQGLLSSLPDIQLISMDCPGHGASSLRDDILPSFEYYADQLIQLMDQLQIEKAFFGGISMGAGISTNIALRFPKRVKGLILIRPAWMDKSHPENLDILVKAANLMGLPNALDQFIKRKDFLAIQTTLPAAAQSVLGVFGPQQRAEIPKVLDALVKDKPFEHLSQLKIIKVPSLIIGNDDDPLHPFEMAKVIHNYIAGSKLEKVCSRYINNDLHKEEVFQLVSKFINNEK